MTGIKNPDNVILKLPIELKIKSATCLLPQTVSELVSDRRHTQDDVKISFDVLKENSVQVGK